MQRRFRKFHSRRASIAVLSSLLMVLMIGLLAMSIDVGYVLAVRTQLQNAADSAALAACGVLGGEADNTVDVAKEFAGYHVAGGKSVALLNSDVQIGTWDERNRAFTPGNSGNAVRVTARRNDGTGGNNLFFARIYGRDSFNQDVTAIATGTPRDIAFVVDLSGSMNDDTEPCWATHQITSDLSPQGYPTVGSDMIQGLYNDFGFGTFPGALQWVGAPAGVTADSRAYANLTKNGGPLTGATVAATYKILTTDNEATRKTKAYRWIIDKQIAVIMPNAVPVPNSATSLGYWTKYLDYVIQSVTVNSGSGTPPSNRGALPPSHDSFRITSLNNPNLTSYPSASGAERDSYLNKIGYRTYVQFMMDHGRTSRPDGFNYTPLSVNSPNCPYHDESTAGGMFSFPPREQPTHAARRSLIAAVQEVKLRNNSIADVNQRDWVSIITFDTVAGTVLAQPLTGNYDQAMQTCTRLQAVADDQNSTATETGLLTAKNYMQLPANGGSGRAHTQKVVVLLTDGMRTSRRAATRQLLIFATPTPTPTSMAAAAMCPTPP
jgi:Flp pilus assembly protein TadG